MISFSRWNGWRVDVLALYSFPSSKSGRGNTRSETPKHWCLFGWVTNPFYPFVWFKWLFRTVLIASAKTIYYTYWMTKTNINKLALCYLYCVYKLTKWYKTSAEFERYYTHCFIIRYYVTTWWSGWVEAGIPWSTTWINMTPVGADFPVRILVEFKLQT